MWFFLSLLNVVLCCAVAVIFQKRTTQNRAIGEREGRLRSAVLPQDATVWYLRYYTDVFKSQNLNSVVSIMTDTFYHLVSTTIKGLNRLGIRKEIEVDPFPANVDGQEDTDAVLVEGKTDISSGHVDCRMVERYIDTQTGQVLFEQRHDKKALTLNVTRSSARTAAEPICCLNCGAEVDTSGEIFVCKHCGTTYRSDSYDWVLSSVDWLTFRSKASKLGGLLAGVILAAMILPMILGIFASGRPVLIAIVVILNLIFLAAVIAGLGFSAHAQAGFNRLAKIDPLASPTVMQRRAVYLMRRLYHAHDHNMADIRPMMDAQMYQYLLQNHRHSGNYVLDFDEVSLDVPRLSMQNGRQVFEANFQANLVVLTPQRRVEFVLKRGKITLYRNQNTRYEHKLQAESFTCGGCGSSLNLTANGSCKYCGLEYDIADFDWKLATVDFGLFV